MKKIISLALSVMLFVSLCACAVENGPHDFATTNTSAMTDSYLPPSMGSTKTADTTVAAFETVTMTTNPNATVDIPELVNGTYECGCAELFHGDYRIETSKNVTITRAGKQISASELVRGELIAVHYSGMIQMTYPGVPIKVTHIEVLPEGASPEDHETKTCMVLKVSCILGTAVFGVEL